MGWENRLKTSKEFQNKIIRVYAFAHMRIIRNFTSKCPIGCCNYFVLMQGEKSGLNLSRFNETEAQNNHFMSGVFV